jgi:hypothetical protein
MIRQPSLGVTRPAVWDAGFQGRSGTCELVVASEAMVERAVEKRSRARSDVADVATAAASAAANAAAPGSGLVVTAGRVGVRRVRRWVRARDKALIKAAAASAKISKRDLLTALAADPLKRDLLLQTLRVVGESGQQQRLVAGALALGAGATSSSPDDVRWEADSSMLSRPWTGGTTSCSIG